MCQSSGPVAFEFRLVHIMVSGSASELGKTRAIFLCEPQPQPYSTACATSSPAANAFRSTRLLGCGRSPLCRRFAKSVSPAFRPFELGDWLSYERAEPEWSVGEWLTGQPSQFSVPSPHQRLATLAQSRVATANWPLPSSRLQKLSPAASARASDWEANQPK